MLICPTVYQVTRGLLLLVLLVGAFIKIKDFYIAKKVNSVGLLTIATSFFFLCYGIVNKSPGAFDVAGVYILWPVLYFVFIGICSKITIINNIAKCFFYVGCFVCVLNLVFIINVVIFNNSVLYSIGEALHAKPGVYDGYIEFSSPSITTVLLLFYFSFMVFVIGNNAFNISNSHLITAILLSIFTLLLSGRRAFWLMILVAPFLVYAFLRISRNSLSKIRKIMPIMIIAGIVLFISILYIYDFEILYEIFLSSFDFTEDESNSIRNEQFSALIERWLERPFLGHGLGAFTPKCIRDPEAVWAYELGYVAGLMNYGIIGFTLYATSIIWIFRMSFKLIKNDKELSGLILPFLSCLFVMLVINATNPYLLKFDYLWTLYMPVLIINTIIRSKKNEICKNKIRIK